MDQEELMDIDLVEEQAPLHDTESLVEPPPYRTFVFLQLFDICGSSALAIAALAARSMYQDESCAEEAGQYITTIACLALIGAFFTALALRCHDTSSTLTLINRLMAILRIVYSIKGLFLARWIILNACHRSFQILIVLIISQISLVVSIVLMPLFLRHMLHRQTLKVKSVRND